MAFFADRKLFETASQYVASVAECPHLTKKRRQELLDAMWLEGFPGRKAVKEVREAERLAKIEAQQKEAARLKREQEKQKDKAEKKQKAEEKKVAAAERKRNRATINYIPPEAPEGLTCVAHCETARSQCRSAEDMKKMNCEMQADSKYQMCKSNAQMKYNNCVASGNKYCTEDFCSKDVCISFYSSCDNDYNICYQTCGGIVEEHTECVKNCEGVETPPPDRPPLPAPSSPPATSSPPPSSPPPPAAPPPTPDPGVAPAPVVEGPENTLDACKDGVDNDGDTWIDCEDQDCSIFAICVK